jgi:phage-related protein
MIRRLDLLIIRFYVTESGRNPVKEFVNRQPRKISARIVNSLKTICIEFPYVRRVDVKHLRGKLWEARLRVAKKNYRIIYTVIASDLLVLHGFIKKKGRAQDEIEIAEKRYKDFYKKLRG